MKREGRQHGMVRNYPILPPPCNTRHFVNPFDSPPTAGLFTKVSRKPTNHSKFTGKCGRSGLDRPDQVTRKFTGKCGRARCSGCHLHPALKSKSKDKCKGTQKLRWRVVDSEPGLRPSGFSVNGILDHLGDGYMDHVDEVDDYMDHDGDGVDEDSVNESGGLEIKNGDHDGDNVDDDDDDSMSFCDVGLWWEEVEGDEGWCMVETM